MKMFSFYVTLVAPVDKELTVRLFEAGCDDGTVASFRGVPAVYFDHKAESLELALRAAVELMQSMNVRIGHVILELRDLTNVSVGNTSAARHT